ncbi:DEAD/DEAH box helicase [Haloechinothrix halophila]|uniref:DEAD/DEAH box helicase n=1 Tax=Haloechinothrix halophila TaxID=1069073 RepID=UPI000A046C4D
MTTTEQPRSRAPKQKPRHRTVVKNRFTPHATPHTTPATSRPAASFDDFGLPPKLLHALREAGITSPFPIQTATLPDAMAGRDVLGRAQTGSGKTLAFGLALLARLNGGKAQPRRPRALVLVPTRELAMQVADVLMPLAKASGLWCRTVVGGMSFTRQEDALKRGVDLLIATPGRLSDHVRQGTCTLSDVGFVALDEADQMADMGFLPQVREILDLTPKTGQRLLFSATLDGAVGQLVRQYLVDPVEHSVAPVTASVTTMEHHVFSVTKMDKQVVAAEIAARTGRTILFVRTKHHADRVAKQLRQVGVPASSLHGGKTQGQRNRVLSDFKDGRSNALVATDVAARGIHVDDVSLVLHVDPPNDSKDYLHRAGRTARAGADGTVVTLITPDQRRSMRRLTDGAGVTPTTIQVRPGDAQLARITGARQPSGEPLAEPQPASRPGGARSTGRRDPRQGAGRDRGRAGARERKPGGRRQRY